MGRSLGDLFWRITGDTSQFDKSVKDTRTEAQKLDKVATKSFGSIKLSSIAMGVATSAVFIKTIGFLKDSAIAAINAQETFSKFDAVFSQMGSAAESAAMQFKDSFDLAEVTAKKMIADTGNILTGFGATQSQALDLSVAVNSLASDLASFTNYTGGAEGASQALTRAMLGERESLKLLGIVIREEDINIKLAAKGQKDLTGNALNLAKAQATLEIATEQGKNAIGDYARTHDSAANTLKRAKEATTELQVQIGTALSPSVSLLGDLWGTVASELAKVIQKRNELRDAEKAAGTEEDTTEKKIIRLQEEDKLLSQRIAKAKQYSQYVTAESIKESEVYQKAIQSKIKGLQLQMQYENAASNQKKEAQRRVEEWNEKEQEEKARNDELAAQRSAIQQEFLAETARQFWMTENGLQTEEEERQNVISAIRAQINAMYAYAQATGDTSIISSTAMQEALAQLEEMQTTLDDTQGKTVSFLENLRENYVTIMGEITGALGDLFSAMYEKESATIDAQLQKRLEAEGLAGENKIERLERERDAARAIGDEVTASEKDAEARRLKIEEEFAKKKAEVKYKADLAQWKLTLAMTVAEGAKAIQVAAGSAPWPFNLPAIAYATGISGLQLAAVKMAQPKMPELASGGIAEPTNGGAIVRVAENGSGEVLFNTGESGQAFIDQMGNAIAQRLSVPVVLEIDGERLATVVVKPINNGRVRLNV